MALLKIPKIKIASTGGTTVSLADHDGPVVLYFYPKDATPGCTLEGADFSRLRSKFAKAGAVVYGVSRDTISAHERFKEKEGYAHDLLSDVDEKLCTHFGVIKMKNMYGKQVRGIERSTFVFDAAHRLAREWRGVKVAGHAEEVLAVVEQLSKR